MRILKYIILLVVLILQLICSISGCFGIGQYKKSVVERVKLYNIHTNLKKHVAKNEKFEITFDIDGEWDNPFDPEQIAVEGHFITPAGSLVVVPGFFYQEFHETLIASKTVMEAIGNPTWKIRFAPVELGKYTYKIKVWNKGKVIESKSMAFMCNANNHNHGFLRISKNNPLYFEFDDGTPFFAVAMDKADNDYASYYKHYKNFAQAGGNFNRLFLTGGHFSIEERITWLDGPNQQIGNMNLSACWRIDQVIELGELLGIYHMMCLTNQTNTKRNGWARHTYNLINGGMLDDAADFFTNEEAIKYFEKRLRYIVARWGYSTSVFSWDLWNEVSSAAGFNPETAVAWYKQVSKYIKETDPYHHIIHSNDSKLNGCPELEGLPEMELVSTNIYAVKNVAAIAEVWTKNLIAKYNKPYLLTEYGVGHGTQELGGYAAVDPERIMVHNGLWSPMMSGSAGTGMPWDWNWLDHENFYNYINTIADFVEDIPFSKRFWKPIKVSSFHFEDGPAKYYTDVLVEGWPGNFSLHPKAKNQKLFIIDSFGNIDPHEFLSGTLGDTTGSSHWRRKEIDFKVKFPVDGSFVIYIPELRGTHEGSQMKVMLNGEEVLNESILPQQVEGYHFKLHNQYYEIPINAGIQNIAIKHTKGSPFLTCFELKNYLPKQGPNLEVRGIQTGDFILLWLKNPKYNWMSNNYGTELNEQKPGKLILDNVPHGEWIVKWVNTLNNKTIKTEKVLSTDSVLHLLTPAVKESVAAKLIKL